MVKEIKVIFYFDGFNFYNGFKSYTKSNSKWKDYFWIDFIKLCSQFIFKHDGQILHKVKYFTAPPQNTKKRSKQNALFAANKILNGDKFETINGHYTNKTINCQATCKESFTMPEEKCTDINLALHIIEDCMNKEVDHVVLITADSDQSSTIKFIKKNFPDIKIKLYFPPDRESHHLASLIKPVHLSNHETKFKNAMMPIQVTNGIKKYTRPENWKS
jgi:uncharacterized LabA/DUF88 family protein